MAEAAFLVDAINGFPMPCGVFLDIEEPKILALDHDALLNVIRGWCAGVSGRGYTPGVYSSEGTLWSKISPEELPDGTLVWVAKWSETPPNTPCDLWQNSDSGRVDGYDGPVDTDVARSERFMTLVEQGRASSRLPQDISRTLMLLANYLQTEEFAESFQKYIEKEAEK
jgi:GH25 family lysozyme M1 (1,4-beta-N-acetylmuramidase)